MSTIYQPGEKVLVLHDGGYEGVIIREYLPDMYEVRLDRGFICVDQSALRKTSAQ